MNKDWVLFHLREAQEELTDTIARFETNPGPSDGEFLVAMAHVYHHLNTAWNSRNVHSKRAWASAEDDFYRWRKSPSDISLARV